MAISDQALIIFDCDGTLVDSEAIAAKIFPQVWASMGLEMTPEFFVENFVGVSNTDPNVVRILSSLPANAMEVADQEFEKAWRSHVTSINGIPDLLDTLGDKICVASNSSKSYLQTVLKKTDLSSYFGDRIFSARDRAAPKPAPDVFLHAAATMGFETADCIVVEDSLAGIQAAKSAGMLVIGFTAGLHFTSNLKQRLRTGRADLYADSVTELQEILNRLLQRQAGEPRPTSK
jgi:HAD superfamily hydrolase (TIGR01509 family)